MVKDCSEVFSKSFLALNNLSRIDTILNLEKFEIKHKILSLVKDLEDQKEVTYTCIVPFDDIEITDVSSYIKSSYKEVKFSQENINGEIKLTIVCVKSETYKDGFIVFIADIKTTKDNLSFTIELNYLQ